tara:strand:- start:1582 stop:2175 length:594 start_codon:yes stop_codon:yes gene_type:complete
LSREGYDAYLLYLGIKLHFHTKSYDFIKYNGKVDATLNAYMKRKDKFHFAKLSRKYKDELKNFYIANLCQKDLWVGDLLENEAHKCFTEWKKRHQKLSYLFETEVTELLKKKGIREVLDVVNGQHPYLLKQYMGKRISPETMCIILDITQVADRWNIEITDTLIYPEVMNKVEKYKSFLSYDIKRYARKLKELCVEY